MQKKVIPFKIFFVRVVDQIMRVKIFKISGFSIPN